MLLYTYVPMALATLLTIIKTRNMRITLTRR